MHREVEHELTFCCATVLARVGETSLLRPVNEYEIGVRPNLRSRLVASRRVDRAIRASLGRFDGAVPIESAWLSPTTSRLRATRPSTGRARSSRVCGRKKRSTGSRSRPTRADDAAIRCSAAAFVAGILLARGRPWEVERLGRRRARERGPSRPRRPPRRGRPPAARRGRRGPRAARAASPTRPTAGSRRR